MGVHSLSRYIKTKIPTAITQIHISKFQGKRVALDVSNYLYKYKATQASNWLVAFYNLFKSFRKFQVHVVAIFDGIPPVEKTTTLRRRAENRENLQKRTEALKNAIESYEKYKAGDTSIDTKIFIDSLQKYTEETELAEEIGDPIELIDISRAKEALEKMISEDIHIYPADIEDLKQLITKIGAKYIQAKGETEPLCYSLFKAGQIEAVISEDSDLLVYGVLNVILGYNMDGSCTLMNLVEILKDLEFTQQQFVDFCIMCGTDYNDNIRGIGPVKAKDLIYKYNTIENVKIVLKGKVPEGYEKSRRLFSDIPQAEKVEYWNPNCDESLLQFAITYGIRDDPMEAFSPTKIVFV
jgi:5'-3' exonuclease